MGAAIIITLIAGGGLVLLLVTVVILDRLAQKAAPSEEQRSRVTDTEDQPEEFSE